MKRLRRIIFNGLSALSLLLCMAMLGLWVRSFSAEPGIEFNRKGERCRICVIRGRLVEDNEPQSRQANLSQQRLRAIQYELVSLPRDEDGDWTLAAFAKAYKLLTEGDRIRAARFRPWVRSTRWELPLGVVATAALPAIALARLCKLRRRKRLGHCSKCGYDLRATPERCPECGTIPAKT